MIYFNALILFLMTLGLDIIYYIVISKTVKSLVRDLFAPDAESFLVGKTFYVILLTLFLSATVFYKRELHELKWVSLLLFSSFIIFVLIVIIMSMTGFTRSVNPIDPEDDDEIPTLKNQVIGVYAMVTAMGFSQMIFPLYKTIKYKTKSYMTKATIIAFVLCSIIYSSFAIACVKIFGDTISDGKFNVMNNINAMYKNDKTEAMFVVTLVLRTIFTCLLVFHVPFIFFISKESMLTIFDEWTRGSIAKEIEER